MWEKGVKAEIVRRGSWVRKDSGPVSIGRGRRGEGGVMGGVFAPCDMVQTRLKGDREQVIMSRWKEPIRGAKKVPNLGSRREGMGGFLNL